MTLALAILAHMVDSHLATAHALQHLRLDRHPSSPLDRRELALFGEIAPTLRRFAGDRVGILRDCPMRSRPALEAALALPDWLLRTAGPYQELVKRWALYGGAGWQPPIDSESAAQTPQPPTLPWGARARWQREIGNTPRELWDLTDPICKLAFVEQIAAKNLRWGDVEGVRGCWEHYQRIVAAYVANDAEAA